MACKEPKQLPGDDIKEYAALADWLYAELKKVGMTQGDLANASGISDARVSRILHGKSVRLTELDINQIALAFRLTPEERDKLRYLAWPGLYEVDKALKRRDGCVFRVNCELAEQDLPLLGSNFEE